jgi:hypothetical protein
MQLLESYSLLKKRKLKIYLSEARQKSYQQIVNNNQQLEKPIADKMQQITGLAAWNGEPVNIDAIKKAPGIIPDEKFDSSGGSLGTSYSADAGEGPVPIISNRNQFMGRNGWKILQSQVARQLDTENPNLQSDPEKTGVDTIDNPLLSDTAKTEEERLHSMDSLRELKLMAETTMPALIAAGWAGDIGRVTQEDSDTPGWVKDPHVQIDSYSPQSVRSKITTDVLDDIEERIKEEGGDFLGERANEEDKHEAVDSFHEFSKKCLKLQQFLNGDKEAFTTEDARWVHTNVVADTFNDRVRFRIAGVDAFGISFDHKATERSKQRETMAAGMARIYDEKIQQWLDIKNKDVPEGEELQSEQFSIPEEKVIPEQIERSKFSDFRGTETERILTFVPQILEVSKLLSQLGEVDGNTTEGKELQAEIERKKEIMATDIAKLFASSETVLKEAFSIADLDKSGKILNDEYTAGIIKTVEALKGLGRNEKEIIKKIFKGIVQQGQPFFSAMDADFVFHAGHSEGVGEKADIVVTKLDEEDYMRALKTIGVTSEAKRKEVRDKNKKTLRELLETEHRKELDDQGLEGAEREKALKEYLKAEKLYKHKEDFDLDREVYTVPISLKTYITSTDNRLGMTKESGSVLALLDNPDITSYDGKKLYKKGQNQERSAEFIKRNEETVLRAAADIDGNGELTSPREKQQYEAVKRQYKKTIKGLQRIDEMAGIIRGDKKIIGSTPTETMKSVKALLGKQGFSISDDYLLDYLTKQYEKKKEDGRAGVRLSTFVQRALLKQAEENASKNEVRQRAYKAVLGSLALFAGASADSMFAMSINIKEGKTKLYNQDDCIQDDVIDMIQGRGKYNRTAESSNFGDHNTRLTYERRRNGMVFGIKSAGCEGSMPQGEISEDVLATFLKAQSILFEKMLPA